MPRGDLLKCGTFKAVNVIHVKALFPNSLQGSSDVILKQMGVKKVKFTLDFI